MKFDLEKALKDGKAITRDGREVTQLTRFDVANEYKIRGVVGNAINSWDESGYCFHRDDKSPHDLQNTPEKLSGFVNVYRSYAKFYGTLKNARLDDTSGLIARIDLSQFNVGYGLEEE